MSRLLIFVGLIAVCLGCAQKGNLLAFGQPAMAGSQNKKVQNEGVQEDQDEALTSPENATEEAPAEFKVRITTTKGDIILKVTREWSPNGADRFYNLVKIGYFEDIAIFRAIEGFMFQFGIHGDPDVSAVWREATIDDDEGMDGVSNQEGYITFAKTGKPNSRSVQFFINLGDNARLDAMGFTPFGKIVEGMDVASEINTEYGENRGFVQGRFQEEGNEFIKKMFPNLDFIESMSLVEDE